MKGYSLCFQFSPNGPMGPKFTDRFIELQSLLGLEPTIGGDEEAYQSDLLAARELLKEAYGFTQEDVENW